MINRIKKVMASVFGISESDIDENASPATIEQWDSLRHMNLVLALEDEFGVSFSDEDIVQMMNLKLLAITIKERLGEV